MRTARVAITAGMILAHVALRSGLLPPQALALRASPVTAATLAALSLLLPQPSFAAEGHFAAGVRLYNEKNYTAAINHFVEVTKTEPRNATAYYYGANCYYSLGKKDEAVKFYWFIVRSFPQSREAAQVNEFLRRIDPNYSRNSSNASAGSLPTLTASASPAAVPAQTKSRPRKSKEQMINQMIKVVKALKDRPNVSSQLLERVKSALRAYPDELLTILCKEDCLIYITPTMIDKDPILQNTKPAGYEEGTTYKNCPGRFDGYNIILCEYTLEDDFDVQPARDPIGTLRHELGHAVDAYLGQISETEEFIHAYRLDVGEIDDEVKAKIPYYLQKDVRGPRETFAELMCQQYGGREDKWQKQRCQLVYGSFKRAVQVLNAKVNSLSEKAAAERDDDDDDSDKE